MKKLAQIPNRNPTTLRVSVLSVAALMVSLASSVWHLSSHAPLPFSLKGYSSGSITFKEREENSDKSANFNCLFLWRLLNMRLISAHLFSTIVKILKP